MNSRTIASPRPARFKKCRTRSECKKDATKILDLFSIDPGKTNLSRLTRFSLRSLRLCVEIIAPAQHELCMRQHDFIANAEKTHCSADWPKPVARQIGQPGRYPRSHAPSTLRRKPGPGTSSTPVCCRFPSVPAHRNRITAAVARSPTRCRCPATPRSEVLRPPASRPRRRRSAFGIRCNSRSHRGCSR